MVTAATPNPETAKTTRGELRSNRMPPAAVARLAPRIDAVATVPKTLPNMVLGTLRWMMVSLATFWSPLPNPGRALERDRSSKNGGDPSEQQTQPRSRPSRK
jgi:hypothetical protein